MTDRKEELLQIEREKWAAFSALLDQIPDDRMEESTLNDDGWSAKDVLWHMRSWDEEIGRELAAIRDGTYEEVSDWETDRKNAEFLAEGRQLDVATVRREAAASRGRAVEAMCALPEITPVAEEWFEESAFRHIDDHTPELQGFIALLNAAT